MDKKKKTNWFKIIITTLFIAYISLYILNITGYYDGSVRRKVEFTSMQIEKFENDVKNGVNVDIEDYLKEQNKNYTNNASRLGYTISSNVDKFLNEGIKGVIKVLSKIFTNE